MKYKILFSLKKNKEKYSRLVCCSCDWHLKASKFTSEFSFLFQMYSINPQQMLLSSEADMFFTRWRNHAGSV